MRLDDGAEGVIGLGEVRTGRQRHRRNLNSRRMRAPAPHRTPAAARLAEARRDITIRPQQIGGAGLGIVALARQGPAASTKPALAADPDRADAFGHIDRGAIGKLQQREARSLPDEDLGQDRSDAPPCSVSGASSIEAPGRGPPRQRRHRHSRAALS